MSKNLEKTYFFSLTLITSLVIFGSIFYWLFNFSPISQIISAFVALVFSFIFMKKLVCPGINKSQILVKTEHSTKNSNEIKKYKLRPSHLIFIISFCMSWLYLLLARTDRALASPWELISPWFFIFFFLTTLSALTISYRKLKFQLGIFSLLFFTASLVAVVIYSLGYGFDPFIHEAGIKAIKALGAISPKTLYYTGQYVLVIFINQISYIPIGAINQFLVPIFSALFLPFSLYFWQKNSLKTKNIFPLMALLILPISVFTITTPQNLSYSLLLVSIFLNLSQSKRGLALASLLSVATFFIHPLAGIPALIFSFLNISYFYRQSLGKTKEKILSWIITILTALALPASFLIINNFKFNLSSPFKLGLFQYLSWPGQENLVFNSVYLYIFNLPILILILIISGIVLWFKQYKQQTPALAVSLKLSLAMFIAYILSQYISFEFLIEYEREYYRQRLLVLTLFFALPFIVFTLKNLFSQLKTQNKTLKIFILIILSLTITASVYYSYPRKDKYFNSHSISVSTADIETVSFIENQAGGDDYIVLANQQVSVAALKTFGFNRYLQDNLYFYPIPTSGPLYPFYLQMVYDYPSFQNMEKALKMSGASKGFLVINKYWWGFKKLVEEAKNEADNFYQLQNGDVYIFEYNL